MSLNLPLKSEYNTTSGIPPKDDNLDATLRRLASSNFSVSGTPGIKLDLQPVNHEAVNANIFTQKPIYYNHSSGSTIDDLDSSSKCLENPKYYTRLYRLYVGQFGARRYMNERTRLDSPDITSDMFWSFTCTHPYHRSLARVKAEDERFLLEGRDIKYPDTSKTYSHNSSIQEYNNVTLPELYLQDRMRVCTYCCPGTETMSMTSDSVAVQQGVGSTARTSSSRCTSPVSPKASMYFATKRTKVGREVPESKETTGTKRTRAGRNRNITTTTHGTGTTTGTSSSSSNTELPQLQQHTKHSIHTRSKVTMDEEKLDIRH